VVPDLAELRTRAAAGDIGCVLYADGEKPPQPPGPIAAASYVAFCCGALLAGGLIAGMGVLLVISFGCVGFLVIMGGISLMLLAASSLASRRDAITMRAEERQEFAKLTGAAHRSIGRARDERTETSVTDRPPK
jgi:hypothetical protein